MSNPFISLEDEVELRMLIKQVHKLEGMVGVFTAMGEVARALEIFGEIAEELLIEEEKNRGK